MNKTCDTQMERVLVIGCSGSGKSTLARQLAERTGLPLVHLDQLWWKNKNEHVLREEFNAALQRELEKPRWIIDGNYLRSLPHRLKYADTVIILDRPKWLIFWRILKRYALQRLGSKHVLQAGNPVALHWSFLWRVWNCQAESIL